MPPVRVIRPFKRRGEIIPPGTVLDIPDNAVGQLTGYVELLDLQRMVGDALAEVDALGRPWPLRFLADLPAEDREQLRQLEQEIDAAVLAGEAVKVAGLLAAWRALLLRRLN